MNQTPLSKEHWARGGKAVDFYGWKMPLHYGSQIEEHHTVRNNLGIFDVSHMAITDIEGNHSLDFLRLLLISDAARMKIGQALYTALLNEEGGVMDDVILYRLDDESYRLVSNCGTRDKIKAWLQKCLADQKTNRVSIRERTDLAIISIQGPTSLANASLYPADYFSSIQSLKSFFGTFAGSAWIARTGYTGEAGLEVIAPAETITELWCHLLNQGVRPIGLAARDTLRLEAGLNLYGQDMDDRCTPLESNMARLVDWQPEDRQFIGRSALQRKQQATTHKLIGLTVEKPGIPRTGQKIYSDGRLSGHITSGVYSPTLKEGIALARVIQDIPNTFSLVIRNQKKIARIARLPFYRRDSKAS